jgi:hypothetical protein
MGGNLRSARLALTALLAVCAPVSTPISSHAATPCTGTGPIAGYLNWYDNTSPGMVADNIHILDPGKPASGCVTVGGGQGVSWGSSGYGQETYVTMPPGTYGGPVRVYVNNYLNFAAVLASQRIEFNKSFNELPAVSAAQAVTTSYFNWYDKASPGMLNDNIHVLNPGTAAATVTVSLPSATPQTVSVAAGAEAYVTFPQGTMGGPVTVSSTQPVLASQRVQFYKSFSEVWAQSAAQAATKNYFSWFDDRSPGVAYDNIHLMNPGTVVATVSVPAGCSYQQTSIPPGGEAHVTITPPTQVCPGGNPFACLPALQCPVPPGVMVGPVPITSDQPVLASQRVQFYSSFDEIWSASASQASTTSYFNWYDRASPGMLNDNIHVFNEGSLIATVTVSVPGASPQTGSLESGMERSFSFPGTIGGPVTVSSDQPVLSSQRVQYYQSFTETWSS